MFFSKKNKKKMVVNEEKAPKRVEESNDEHFNSEDYTVGTRDVADKVTLFNEEHVSTVKGTLDFSDMIDKDKMDSIVQFIHSSPNDKDRLVEETMGVKGARWNLGDYDRIIITPIGVIVPESSPGNYPHVMDTIQSFVTFLGRFQIGVNNINIVQSFDSVDGAKVKFFVGERGRLSFSAPKNYYKK